MIPRSCTLSEKIMRRDFALKGRNGLGADAESFRIAARPIARQRSKPRLKSNARYAAAHIREGVFLEFAHQQAIGIDRARQRQPAARRARESHTAVIGLVADEQDETMSSFFRRLQRASDEIFADASRTERWIYGQRTQQQRRGLFTPDMRHDVRADQERADARDEGQFGSRRAFFPETIGRSGKAARAEAPFVQLLDGWQVGRRERGDGERDFGHG
jgi:hypothetical protein